MTAPAGLVGAALVFWGWQTGFLVVGVVMAAVIEARHLLRVRWDLSRADFNRVSDLSAVLLVLIAVYQILGNDSARAVLAILEWLPLTLFPLVACQLFSADAMIDASVFFWSLRRQANARPDYPRRPVDLSYPFVALALLSSSAANVRTGVFFAGFAALSAWALWSARPRAYAAGVWALVMAGVIALGWAGHVGIAAGQRLLERTASAWLLDLIRRDTDPFKTSTALGQVGEVKLSGRVVLRVESPAGVTPPPLLREAAYNVYNAPAWYAVDAPFLSVQPDRDGLTWRLAGPAPERGAITVAAYLRRGKGILAAPNGALRLDDLFVVELARNRMGAIRVEEGLGLVRYRVSFGAATADGPPTRMDLAIPRSEAAVIARVAEELDLAARSPAEAARAIRAYFLGRFGYARYLGERPAGASALEDFFFRTRRGHCEYFGTAAVLLLRAAGIPARYAVGHAVHEWSAIERRYVVRSRDAHAWALAWIDGAWRDFDTTPPDWIPVEQAEASALTPLGDLWSWATYLFSRWRWSEREDRLTGSIGWLLIPLMAVLAWRLYSRRRVAARRASRAAPPGPRAGGDSEFYLVEQRLAALAFPRAPAESLACWIARVEAARLPAVGTARLPGLLALHYRHRFDPHGLGAADRAALGAEVRAWLAEHGAPPRR